MRVLAVFILALSALACSDKPTQKQCEQLLDNVLTIYAPVSSDESEAAQKSRETQKQAVREQVGNSFLGECMDTLPGAQVRCALKARSEKDLAACEEPS